MPHEDTGHLIGTGLGLLGLAVATDIALDIVGNARREARKSNPYPARRKSKSPLDMSDIIGF